MSEFPKLITDCDPKWLKFFEAEYFHERRRLNLPVDLFVPSCPLCDLSTDENEVK